MPALPDRINGAIKRGTDVSISSPNGATEGTYRIAFADAVGVAVWHALTDHSRNECGFDRFIPWSSVDHLEILS